LRCWTHNRAYDCIRKAVYKDNDSEEVSAFEDAFGKGKGDDGDVEKQNVIMTSFLETYPDGCGKPGKKRGKDFKVASVMHGIGYRKEQEKASSNRMWDFELFCNNMKMLRGWDATRCRTEFDLIKADPDCDSDMGGPRWSRERVEVPAYLTGEVTVTNRSISFEDRRLVQSTKAKAPAPRATQLWMSCWNGSFKQRSRLAHAHCRV
jgi:hypothetical protein